MADDPTEKSEAEVLFPEQEIYGVKLRPWTYEQFVSVLPILIGAQKSLKEHGIGTDQLEGIGQDAQAAMEFLSSVAPLLPVVELISRTTGINQEQIRQWEFDRTIGVFLVVVLQNVGRLKNFSGLGLAALGAMRRAR